MKRERSGVRTVESGVFACPIVVLAIKGRFGRRSACE
jgi:hypothetical protein